MVSARWLFAGLLVGIGIVGYLTGLIVAAAGLAFALYLLSVGAGGAWFFVVGIGLGAAALTLDDVLHYGDGSCRQVGPAFHECPAAGIPEIFWSGLIVAGIGFIGAIVARQSARRKVDSQTSR